MLHVKEVKHLSVYQLWLAFDNGVSRICDLLPELWGEMFESLKDKKLFTTVTLDPVLKTIKWDNGADFAPEFLLELVTQSKFGK